MSIKPLSSDSSHPFTYSKRMSHGWTSLESALMLIYSGLLTAGYDPEEVWQPVLEALYKADYNAVNDQGDPPW